MKRDKIFGINPVTEALKAGRPIQRLLIAEQRKSDRDILEIIRLAKGRGHRGQDGDPRRIEPGGARMLCTRG